MTTERLTKSVRNRICKHMNSDHQNALMKYASHYGGIKIAQEVRMTNLTSEYLELSIDKQIIQIEFDHRLENSEDAHKTLIKMLKSIPC